MKERKEKYKFLKLTGSSMKKLAKRKKKRKKAALFLRVRSENKRNLYFRNALLDENLGESLAHNTTNLITLKMQLRLTRAGKYDDDISNSARAL